MFWLARFGLGLVLLLVAGLAPRLMPLRDSIGLVPILAGLWGFHLALTSIRPLVRIATHHTQSQRTWSQAARTAFARASLPRRIYHLLVAVAEADGPITPAERSVVRHFVLERFRGALGPMELDEWERIPFGTVDLKALAAYVALGLEPGEVDTLFCWACLVAFADGRFRADEHEALQTLARGLALAPARARMLFQLARAQFLQGRGSARRDGPRRTATAADPRSEALAVLGLEPNATTDQIRRRHRELVRKFHPDAQPHLGPVAQREATERFTAIQRAYETLTASRSDSYAG